MNEEVWLPSDIIQAQFWNEAVAINSLSSCFNISAKNGFKPYNLLGVVRHNGSVALGLNLVRRNCHVEDTAPFLKGLFVDMDSKHEKRAKKNQQKIPPNSI